MLLLEPHVARQIALAPQDSIAKLKFQIGLLVPEVSDGLKMTAEVSRSHPLKVSKKAYTEKHGSSITDEHGFLNVCRLSGAATGSCLLCC